LRGSIRSKKQGTKKEDRMDKIVKSNSLNIFGWFYAGKYQIERYAYILHRLSGLAILLYLMMHIYVTSLRVNGREAWEDIMGKVGAPVFHIGEYLLFIAVAYHALNGLRLIFQELGFLLPAPERPVYPHVTALSKVRIVLMIAMFIALVLMFIGGLDFFVFD
jgi:succinate dehydrogenase / fumarate reductase cytochrome b subunit